MNILKNIKVSIVTFFLLFLITGSVNAKTPFVFGYEAQELFPYFMGNTSKTMMKNPGVTIEMVKLLERYLPVSITFVRHSWKRNLVDLKAGKVDGIVASYKPDRLEFGVYPLKKGTPDMEKSLDLSSYYLYVKDNTHIVWYPDKMKFSGVKSPIGVPYGYSIVALLKKTDIKVDEYGNTRENLIKLLAGRLSGAALLEFDADRILFHEKNRFPGIIKLEPSLISKHYYLILSHQFYKKYTQLSERIWQSCGKIRENYRESFMARYLQMPY